MPNAAAQIALCAALPLPVIEASETAPEFIHLVPAGDIRTVDGRGPYRMASAASVVAAFPAGARLPVDENHSTDLAAPKGGSSPARGWIVGLQARADGVWGQVEWTREGRRLVRDRAYRHISPAIRHAANGEVLGVERASLVNLPNLRGLTALHQQQDGSMEMLVKLRQALGLPEDADEAAIMAAIGRMAKTNKVETHSAIAKAVGLAETAGADVALQAIQASAVRAKSFAAVLKELGLDDKADGAVALQAVKDLRDPTKMVPASSVVALQSQLTALSDSVKKDKAESVVDAAIVAGKVGVKPLRDHYVARHMADPAGVEKEFAVMVALQSGARPRPEPKAGEPVLSSEEEHAVALMGIDPKAFAKAREAEEAR